MRRLLASLVAGGLASGVMAWRAAREADGYGAELASVAAEAAALLDGDAHAEIRTAEDPAFLAARHVLREVHDRHHLRSPLYTLRRDGDSTSFVAMTNEMAFVGDRYVLRPEMLAVLERGETAHTRLYRDDHGWWISGYAPVRSRDGRVVALVDADRPAEALAAARLGVPAAGMITAAAAWMLGGLEWRRGPVGALRRWARGRIAARIGLAGAAAVVLATAVSSGIDQAQARERLLAGVQLRLGTVVRLAATHLPVEDVVSLAASGDAGDPAFERVRGALRRTADAGGVVSPMYVLEREGELARFVAMTNEVPYVGDPLALRPGHRETFDGAGPGAEGPYTDAHGTWVSAWAPITGPDGAVVALVQADEDVDALLAELRRDALARGMTALVGVGVAFGLAAALARTIARPIGEVAEAARAIGGGSFTVKLPEDGEDEVGDLARSVSAMAKGLWERERLRDMFGRYMTRQVADRLLATSAPIALSGEVREVTVLLSDIRGYTALTERLGAGEVVALLNEYFAILVDAVSAHDGVVDKYMGDAMLCWFGAPVPQADHARRAVAAASDIMRRLDAWNQSRVARGLPEILTGIGVATGEVLVGNIGSPERMEYTAIGDAVNLASRLCSKAEGRVVLASDAVRRGAPAFLWDEVGPMVVKGVKEPVEVWRLKG